jgi:hypothetical protein
MTLMTKEKAEMVARRNNEAEENSISMKFDYLAVPVEGNELGLWKVQVWEFDELIGEL